MHRSMFGVQQHFEIVTQIFIKNITDAILCMNKYTPPPNRCLGKGNKDKKTLSQHW